MPRPKRLTPEKGTTPDPNLVQWSMKIEPELLAEMKKVAKSLRRSASSQVKLWIEEGLRRHREK